MSRHALLVLVLSACGSGSSQKSSSPPPAPPATPADSPAPVATKPAAPPAPKVSAACTEQATKLGSTMSELGKAQPGFLPMVKINAPVSKGAKPVDKRGIVFALTKDGAIYAQGQKVKDVAEARMYLDQAYRTSLEKTMMDGGTHADATVILYIWADRATPARTIAALAAATEEEKPKPGKAGKKAPPKDDPPPPEEDEDDKAARDAAVKQAKEAGIIGGPDKPRPPAFIVRLIVTSADNAPAIDAAIGAKLPASDPEATKAVVAQLKAAIGTCEPVFTALATASLGGTPDKELAKLTTEVPAGLTACQCKAASIDDLTTGIRLWFGAWAPSLQWIDLPKLKATDKQPISKLVK